MYTETLSDFEVHTNGWKIHVLFCNMFRNFFSVKIKQPKNYTWYLSQYTWIYIIIICRITFPHIPSLQEHRHYWNAQVKIKLYWFQHLFFYGKIKSYFKLIRPVKEYYLLNQNYKCAFFKNICYFQCLV